MNTELLFQLYAIHSPSGGEKKMRKFIKKYIYKNCGDVKITQDVHGNLLCTKGQSDTYPCLASHMDQVQKNHSKDFQCVVGKDVVFGYSAKAHEQQGLGADDKNGIWICLECLKKFDVLKVAFFVEEESGCGGSDGVDLKFFKDCRFIIEPDRRGGADLITSMFCGKVCSDDFIKAIGYEQFGYDFDRGSVTDVGELVDRGVGISCLNLSCGYYEAHTDTEFTVLSELDNCLAFVEHIVETCTDVYPFEGGYGGWYGGYGSYGRYFEDDYCYGYGKLSNAASGKTSSIQTLKSSAGESQSQWEYDEYDDYMYYYDGGYYDEDYAKMEEYLQIQPDLTFDQIKLNYAMDFNACHFFGYEGCLDFLSDIYNDIKNSIIDKEESESVEDIVGEISFDDIKLRKAS